MNTYGFFFFLSASPVVRVADVEFNTGEICRMIGEAVDQGVSLLAFPELSLTGYTCGDLFSNNRLLEAVQEGLEKIRAYTEGLRIAVVVGAPVRKRNKLYNCAVVIADGKIAGSVPKIYLPDYNEFYESRWFTSGSDFLDAGEKTPIFTIGGVPFCVELCEDLWAPVPPSSFHALEGAEVIVNISGSNELFRKQADRKRIVSSHSARTFSGYVYACSGYGESTQDLVFAGSSLIYENGRLLSENPRFETRSTMISADIDIEALRQLRQKQSSFAIVSPDGSRGTAYSRNYDKIDLGAAAGTDFDARLLRSVHPHPFLVPAEDLDAGCREILDIQTTGLVTRLDHIHCQKAILGISGGLDSTLALLVTALAFDRLGLPRTNILGITMPGLGTSGRTRNNAGVLMDRLGISWREIPLGPAIEQHFKDIGHDPEVKDTAYENAQARERTQILMDIANAEGGIVVGTGDLSELALGWCTYNGDHMSMYAVNASVPKTLVRQLCTWASEKLFPEIRETLLDIVDTPISPELKTEKDEALSQRTEDIIGPYELNDFFLYHFLRYGASPEKIFFLSKKAFAGSYDEETLHHWLRNFLRRFFSQQFKRSCLPDGPKVSEVSLSPRGDWRMPSDISSEGFQI